MSAPGPQRRPTDIEPVSARVQPAAAQGTTLDRVEARRRAGQSTWRQRRCPSRPNAWRASSTRAVASPKREGLQQPQQAKPRRRSDWRARRRLREGAKKAEGGRGQIRRLERRGRGRATRNRVPGSARIRRRANGIRGEVAIHAYTAAPADIGNIRAAARQGGCAELPDRKRARHVQGRGGAARGDLRSATQRRRLGVSSFTSTATSCRRPPRASSIMPT
jgi:hypothetical protein